MATPPGQQWGSEMDLSLTPNAEKRRSRTRETAPEGVGFACRKGIKPSPNQDSWSMHIDGDVAAYGVFDGHGDRGHLVSHAVKSTLTREVAQVATAEVGDVASSVQAAYRRAHLDVCGSSHLGPKSSGTTATVVVHDRRQERLVVSNVGDSTAVLLRRSAGQQRLVAEQLTLDHRPGVPSERERILRSGGQVLVDGGCHRVTRRGERGGLNLSRSLGDASVHAVGVSELPPVEVRDVGPQDVALLIASDGVWEVMAPQEAADLVHGHMPSQAMEAANRIVDEAMRRWKLDTAGQRADDICAVLAWLPQPRKRRDEISPCSTAAPSCTSSLSSMRSDDRSSLRSDDRA